MKLFILSIAAFVIMIIGYNYYEFSILKFDKVHKLKNNYISFTIDTNNKPQYKIVKSMPSAWVKLDNISYMAAHSILVSEDWGFYQHSGYDLNQIRKAFTDIITDKRYRGASTITQQLVKNLFLSNEKSISRKLKEFLIAIKIENVLSKKEILEIYLNIIEYGEGLFGIKNASYFYFKKHPKDLTPKEGAFLAMLLPNPKKYSQSFRDQHLTEFATKIIKSILDKMIQAKYISKEDALIFKLQKFGWEIESPSPEKPNLEVTPTEMDELDESDWGAEP
jgi:monofunctional biosynthetic peptidoglycan transglycosylase